MMKNKTTDRNMKTRSTYQRLRALDDILTTVSCIERDVDSPRELLARMYSLIFLALAFVAAPEKPWFAQATAAILAAVLVYQLLRRCGPGHRSWWARLSSQLWAYQPADGRALEALRGAIAAMTPTEQRSALARIVGWTRIELTAITHKCA